MDEMGLPENAEQDPKKKGGGMMPLIAAVALVTLVGGGGGALVGSMVGGSAPETPAQSHADAAEAHGAEADDGHGKAAKGGHAEDGESLEGEAPLVLVPLKPVLTNIYNPAKSWIRIEASIIVRQTGEADPAILAAEIEADTLAFARSLQIAQVEGTRGLLHLREDLKERAKLRSPDVVDYLIQAMVVE